MTANTRTLQEAARSLQQYYGYPNLLPDWLTAIGINEVDNKIIIYCVDKKPKACFDVWQGYPVLYRENVGHFTIGTPPA